MPSGNPAYDKCKENGGKIRSLKIGNGVRHICYNGDKGEIGEPHCNKGFKLVGQSPNERKDPNNHRKCVRD